MRKEFLTRFLIFLLLISGQKSVIAQGTQVNFTTIPKSGTILVYAHLDDDLIWMLPFWNKTEKFIGGGMPASLDYRTIISQQQTFMDNNGYNIDYESNWYTPWDDITWYEYQEYYLHGNQSFNYLVNDHLESRLYNDHTELSRFEINKIKAKIEQYFADPTMRRVVTHNNWGEYGHRHHLGVNLAVRELAVKYRKDVWMLGCNNGNFVDVTVPDGITWAYGSFNTPVLFTGIRTIYENNGRWTWYSDSVPSGNHKFIKIVDSGSDKSDILKGDEITYPGPSQLESGAYLFDGDDDYMTLKGNCNPHFTIAMRIRPEQIRNMDICDMSEYPLSSKNDRNLYLGSNGKISARIYDGSSRLMASSAVISAGTWTHIAITGNGSSFKLYINGELDRTISSGTAITDFSTPEFILGQATMTGSNFSGQINDVKLFDFAMTDSEIAEMSGMVFNLTSSYGQGGTIDPSGTTTVTAGTDRSFTITPASDHRISEVVVDNSTQGTISSYTFMNVTSDHTISATFTRITYTMSSVAGTGGSITPPGSSIVNYGSSFTFQIVPITGFMISDVKIDNVSAGAISSYTFDNIISDHTISANFTRITYTISSVTETGGSITPAGSSIVNPGSSSIYQVVPNSGFVISDVKIDNVSAGAISSYAFNNVISNHTISASFTPIPFIITGSSGKGGSISPHGIITVNYGTDLIYSIKPDIGYQVSDVMVDNKPIGPVSEHTFTNVTESHSISANFSVAQYTVNADANSGGSITPDGKTVLNYGSNLTYSFKPNHRYKISDIKVDGISKGAVSSYSFINITDNHTISVIYTPLIEYSIYSRSLPGGSIFPSGSVKQFKGSDQDFSIIPDEGCRILDVVIDNHSVGALNKYKFSNIVSDHNILVRFTTSIDVNVYPNPFANEFKIYITSPEGYLIDMIVADLSGKIVYTQNKVPGNTIIPLNLHVPQGLYFINLFSRGKNIKTIKVVKS